VHIGFDDDLPPPRASMMLARVVTDAMAVPVEAGTATVTLSVSGCVKLQQVHC